jgi:predicted homoserine dehydrogenase-like protein
VAIVDAISAGRLAITADPLLAAASDAVDVIVDATGVPEAGALHAVTAIDAGHHIVMVNVEADVTVGAALRRRADAAGVVYTLVDGDQPGCTMHMIEWARTLGFEIVAAGRGTIYYATDRDGTPDTVQERFGFSDEVMRRRTINTKMYNSFRDGTKAQVEMTALANMTGLPPDVRGMHEPSVNLEDVPRQFSLQQEGGLLGRSGVVELANSIATDGQTTLPNPLNMGVFCVIRAEHPFIMEDLAGYGYHAGDDGHNLLLWRPYHLVAVEAPLSIAAAVLYGRPTGAPLPEPTADTIAVAKRDLQAGETIDGGGGYTVNGVIEKAAVSQQEGLLPLGLSDGATLTADVARGRAVRYADVELPGDSLLRQLRREQGDAAA